MADPLPLAKRRFAPCPAECDNGFLVGESTAFRGNPDEGDVVSITRGVLCHVCGGVQRVELRVLDDVPLDGTYDVMIVHPSTEEYDWQRFTPRHHLASVAASSPLVAFVRPTPIPPTEHHTSTCSLGPLHEGPCA